MGKKKQKRIQQKITSPVDLKIERFKRQKINFLTPKNVKNEKFILTFFGIYGLLFIVVAVYLGLSLWQINAPFVHVSEDTNGTNGIGAANLARLGFFKLKFGLYNRWVSDISNKDLTGKFYAHHPIGFLLPTAIFYKLFGINEITTRLGPLFLSLLAFILFYFAIYKIFKDSRAAFLCSLVFAVLPGAVYYGKHLDMSPPSLAFILISFSLFIFHYFEKKRLYFYLFLLSIFLGGLTAWHYFFMPFGIWLFILFTKIGKLTPERKKYLWFLPILILFAFFINILHIYIVNGLDGVKSWEASFFYRSARQQFIPWLLTIFQRMQLNFTLLFIITSIIGLVFLLFKLKTEKNLMLFLPILLLPLFISAIFMQWSTHPFGPIYFIPLISISTGLLLYYIVKSFDIGGWFIVFVIFAFGLTLSIKNLNFFYDKFLILGKNDPQLLKDFRSQVKDNELCQGRNNFGIDLNGISNWYLQKEMLESPDCFATTTIAIKKNITDEISTQPTDKNFEGEPPKSSTLKYGLVFVENFDEIYKTDFYKKEIMLFQQNGFKSLIKCADSWCLISK